MRKLFVVLLMLAAVSASGQWVVKFTDSTTHFTDIKFTSASNGFAVGYKSLLSGLTEGKVYKTTNAGNSWALQSVGSIPGIFGLCFADQNTGWFVGDKGLVRKTTDGGLNWVQQTMDSTQYSERVYFLNSATGWISGNFTYKTTNGGINWIKITSAPSPTFGISFINESTGFLTSYSSRIHRTTDAGVTWNQVYAGDFNTFIYDISFSNNSTGWAVGESQSDGVLKTTDGGLNWGKVLQVSGIKSLYFKDANTGWIGNVVTIDKTTNGGLSWSQQPLPAYVYSIRRIVSTNDSSLFAVGTGYIFKTTNGGVGIGSIGTETPLQFKLYQNYPNPFNPVTNIYFEKNITSGAKILIYDVVGRKVLTLVDENLPPGKFNRKFDGAGFPSGVYFYKLIVNGQSETKKMLMIK